MGKQGNVKTTHKRAGKRKEPYRGLTGYRLHLKRFAHTGEGGTRSMKYPLVSKDADFFNAFAESIIHDYNTQMGAINLPEWLKEQREDQAGYSLMDFWIDTLRAGFIYAPSTAKLKQRVLALGGLRTPADKLTAEMRQANRAFADALDIDAFIAALVLPKEVRKGKSGDSFVRVLASCARSAEDAAYLQKEAAGIFRRLQKLDRRGQDAFWEEQYGVDKSLFRVPAGGREFSAFPLPRLPFDEEESLTPYALIRRFREIARESGETDSHQEDAEEDERAQERRVKAENERLLDMLGLNSNQNALSGMLNIFLRELQDASVHEELLNQLQSFAPLWSGKEKERELRRRVEWLAARAQRLPRTPQLAGSWADYRTTFGGKLQSWVSNVVRQERQIIPRIEAQRDEIADMQERIRHTAAALNTEEGERLQELRERASEAQMLAEHVLSVGMDSVEAEEALMLYRDALGDVRDELNQKQYLLQTQEKRREKRSRKRAKREEESVSAWAGKRWPNMHKPVPLIPALPGEAKHHMFTRYARSPQVFRAGGDVSTRLHSVFQEAGEPIEVEREYALVLLTRLARKYAQLNSERFRHVLAGWAKRHGIPLVKAADNDEVFYLSPYARSKKKVCEYLASEAELTQALVDFARETLSDWRGIEGKPEEMADAVEIERMRAGVLTQLWPGWKAEITEEEVPPELFRGTQAYFHTFGSSLSGRQLGTFLQRVLLSEMKGAVNRVSRDEFLVRYTVQIIHADERYPLFADAGGGELSASTRVEWGITPKDNVTRLRNSDDEAPSAPVYAKAGKAFVGDSERDFARCVLEEPEKTLRLRSSRYQMQFLDTQLPGRGTDALRSREAIALNEYSFICEDTYRPTWDYETGGLSLQRQDDERRLFVSVPFSISSRHKEEDTKRAEGDKSDRRSASAARLEALPRYVVGIDVGEYGLAYMIVDIAGTPTAVRSGFVYDDALRRIRHYVGKMKSAQVRGTFSAPSTELERIRENAVTTLRNRIHDLVVRYKAQPVYEFNISAFESGGNRVAKVYRSVKVADVPGDTEADKSERELVWGRWKAVGAHISAYATSHICSKCHESVYAYIPDVRSDEMFAYERPRGAPPNVISVKLAEGVTTHGFINRSDFKDRKQRTLSAEEARRFILAYARPPYEVFVKRPEAAQYSAEALADFVRCRGNSAVFTCPFCDHVADADKQAALMVATKYIVRKRNPKQYKSGVPVSIEALCDELKQWQTRPVPLQLSVHTP